MSKVPSRKYQSDCQTALDRFYETHSRGLIAIPTGGGKTIIFTIYAEGKRTVVISHTDELVAQAVEKASFVYGSSHDCGFIQRELWDYKKSFVSASIQTLHANLETDRFKDFVQGGIELVVIDEAHHTSAATYQAVLQAILEANPDAKVLGVTATPFRMDDKDLADFFEDLVYFIDIKELIRLGYLVPVDARIISLGIDLDELKVSGQDSDADFNQTKLSELLNQAEVTQMIVDRWFEHARDRKTIFFTSSIEHSKAICEALVARGVKAVHVDGTMSLTKRKATVAQFKNGEIDVLTNMNIFTEGFDDPAVDCVALIRPTQSQNLYAQIIGRGLRPSPDTGKKDCLVLDYTGVSKNHRLANLFELFGVTVDEKHKEETREFKIGSVLNEDDEREIKILFANESGDFDFFGNEASDFITVIDPGKKVLSCGKNNKFIFLEKDEFGLWKLNVIQGGYSGGSVIETIENMPSDYSLSFAIEKWNEHRDEFAKEFVSARSQPPTQKQIQFMNQLVSQNIISGELVAKSSRFDASNILSWGFYLSGEGKAKIDAGFTQKVTDMKCPLCGNSIVSTKMIFKCSTNVYRNGESSGCPFGIFRENRLLELTLEEEHLKTLLNGDEVRGENGKAIVLDLTQKFFTRAAAGRSTGTETQKKSIVENIDHYERDGKKVGKVYNGAPVSKEQAEEILDGKKAVILSERGTYLMYVYLNDAGELESSVKEFVKRDRYF